MATVAEMTYAATRLADSTLSNVQQFGDRYVFVREIGRGGMGRVILVFDRVLGMEVALKHTVSRDVESLVRFKAEFRVVEGLNHANLVRLHELGVEGDELFFTMEFVDGVDLEEYCLGTTPKARPEDGDHSQCACDRALAVSETAVSTTRTLRASGLLPVSSTDETLLAMTVRAGGDTADRMDRQSNIAKPVVDAAVVLPLSTRLQRLRSTLPQLLTALSHLHNNGLVHCDLKPANVLVRNDGVVKLVDFGILAELGHGSDWTKRELAGTLGYIAPERLRGAPPSPEADLYAFGAMMFHLVCGRPVFGRSGIEVLRSTLDGNPPSVASIEPDAPESIVRACAGLLDKNPERRPSIAQLAAWLDPAVEGRTSRVASSAPRSVELVGRAAIQSGLQEQLGRSGRGDFVISLLVGPSGVGKTSLAEWSAGMASEARMAVIRGRGRSNDRVPFNAMDSAIDDLLPWISSHKQTPQGAELERLGELAKEVFPVLAARRTPQHPSTSTRGQAFTAVSDLLDLVATVSGGLLVVIDDLQWADSDSVALLDHIADRAPPFVSIIGTLRNDTGDSVGKAWSVSRMGVRRIDVEPLAASDVAIVVRRAALSVGLDPDSETLAAATEACAGRPFWAEIAGRRLRDLTPTQAWSADIVVQAIVEQVGTDTRDVLAALVARDGWTEVDEIARITGKSPGAVHETLRLFEHEGLVRRGGASHPLAMADLYHDVIRAACTTVLGEEALRRAHDNFADLLLASPQPPAYRLVRHLASAGRLEHAARMAIDLAPRAEEQHAYGLAADLYAVALQYPGTNRIEALRRRAAALEKGSRYHEAATCWEELSTVLTGEAAVDALLMSAHDLLAVGKLAQGRQRLNAVLLATGRPPLRVSAMTLLVLVLMFIGPLRTARPLGSRDPKPLHLDPSLATDGRIGMLLTYFDSLAGLPILYRARAQYLRAGHGEQAAWCDCFFAYGTTFAVIHRGPSSASQRYLRHARQVLGDKALTILELKAFPDFVAGVTAQRAGAWTEARAALERAVAVFQSTGQIGTFFHLLVFAHRTQVDAFAHDIPALQHSLASFREAARETDALSTRCHLTFVNVLSHVFLRGDVDAAREEANELRRVWPRDVPSFQRFLVDFVGSCAGVFGENIADARETLMSALRRDWLQAPFRTMYRGIFGAVAAMLEARAVCCGVPDASVRRVLRLASKCNNAPPFCTSAGFRACAYAVETQGDRKAVLAWLDRAQAEAEEFSQHIDIALARHARGVRLGGDEGATLRARALETLVQVGANARMPYLDDPLLQ